MNYLGFVRRSLSHTKYMLPQLLNTGMVNIIGDVRYFPNKQLAQHYYESWSAYEAHDMKFFLLLKEKAQPPLVNNY